MAQDFPGYSKEANKYIMSTMQECSAEQLAKLFHRYRNALAADFGCSGEPDPPEWEYAPENQRRLMIAAARLALRELSEDPRGSSAGHAVRSESTEFDPRYFSRPGEAEWGC